MEYAWKKGAHFALALLLVLTLPQGPINPKPAAASHGDPWHVFRRVSVGSNGAEGNSGSFDPSISADGRFVAFDSFASNLVAGDTNGFPDVFVHDRQTGQTSRVGVASDGAEANRGSDFPSISADGRLVAFNSSASNLVAGDTNLTFDVFVHDRQTGQTSRVSVASDGGQANGASFFSSISADGRLVAFDSRALATWWRVILMALPTSSSQQRANSSSSKGRLSSRRLYRALPPERLKYYSFSWTPEFSSNSV